jgi:phosphohistidine phosphatase
MKLYLLRHAHAVSEIEDPARPLSARGREQARAVGGHLARHGRVRVSEVWHSRLVRARETAEIVAAELALAAPRREVAGLCPEDPPEGTARRVERSEESLLVVGHEPHLSGLAGLLLRLDPDRAAIEFKKGALLCLERPLPGAPWSVVWLLTPRLAGAED